MKLVEVAKVGDYVEYDTFISGEKNYEEMQREHMNWRVLKNDGEVVILISEGPTESKICFEAAEGYLDGPNKLDKIADELYSSKAGKSRNIKIEDINEILGYKADEVECCSKKVAYGTKISELEEIFNKALIHRETPDRKDICQYCQTYYMYYGNEYMSENSIEYQLICGKNGKYRYWISSSCVDVDFYNGYADFCLHFTENDMIGANFLYDSSGDFTSNSFPVRPIVILNSSALVANEQTDGKTSETAWKIA